MFIGADASSKAQSFRSPGCEVEVRGWDTFNHDPALGGVVVIDLSKAPPARTVDDLLQEIRNVTQAVALPVIVVANPTRLPPVIVLQENVAGFLRPEHAEEVGGLLAQQVAHVSRASPRPGAAAPSGDDLRVGTFVTDLRGRIYDVNADMVKLLGVSREALLELNAIDLYDDPGARRDWVRVLSDALGRVVEQVVQLRSPARGAFDARIRACLVLGSQGDRIHGIVSDLTEVAMELQNLQRKTQAWESLLGLSGVARYATDPQGRTTRTSPEELEILGYRDPREILSKDRADLLWVHPNARAECLARIDRDGSVHDYITAYKRKNGRELVWVRCHAQRVSSGDSTSAGVQGMYTDVTAEHETARYQAALHQCIRECTSVDHLPPIVARVLCELFAAERVLVFVHDSYNHVFVVKGHSGDPPRVTADFAGRYVHLKGGIVEALKTGEPYIGQVARSRGFEPLPGLVPGVHTLVVPLGDFARSAACVWIEGRYTPATDSESLQRMRDFLLGTSEVVESLQRRQCAALHAKSRQALSKVGTSAPPSILSWVLDWIRAEIPTEAGSLFTTAYVANTERLQLVGTTGIEGAPEFHEVWYELSEGLTGRVASRQKIRVLLDVDERPEKPKWPEKVSSPRRRSWLGVPLQRVDGRVIGVIRLVNRVRHLDASSVARPWDAEGPLTWFCDWDIAIIVGFIQQAELIVSTLHTRQQLFSLLADVTHEMRAPVARLRGNLDIMRRRKDGDPQLFERKWDDLKLDIEHIARLARNLDALYGHGKHVLGRGPTSLWSVLQPLKFLLKPDLRTRGYELDSIKFHRIYDAPKVAMDSTHLTQVFFNLFDNALRYYSKSARHGEFRIVVEASVMPDSVEVHFKDWGVGVREDDRQRIFERGVRGRDSSQVTHGTGLGLSICRELLALYDGTITLGSPSNPTDFVLKIPRFRKERLDDPSS